MTSCLSDILVQSPGGLSDTLCSRLNVASQYKYSRLSSPQQHSYSCLEFSFEQNVAYFSDCLIKEPVKLSLPSISELRSLDRFMYASPHVNASECRWRLDSEGAKWCLSLWE